MSKIVSSWKHILVVSLGTVLWSLTMARSGLLYYFGLGFWGANGHDGIWHLALIRSLASRNFENPVFAGELIKNYHIGFDLFLALINQVTKIPINYLYFQVLPPIFALLIGILTYKFVDLWRGSKAEALWATAFVYFSGGFGFIVTLLRDRVFTGESMFWSQQAVSTLINPPFALSLIFILSGLIFLQKYQKTYSTYYLILSSVFFGLLIQIKAYAAILVLGGLFVSAVYSYYILHTTYYIRVFIGSIILNLIFFFSINNDGLSSFVWQPFWFLETMMSYSDRLGWERFYSAMTTYKMGHIWFKGILAYITAFVIFVIGNLGLRVIGFYFLIKTKIDSMQFFIVSMCLGGLLIPLFFVQKGTPWNTIQFFYYFLFFFAIFAGVATSWIRTKLKYPLFIIFSIFSVWSTLQHYLPKMPQAIISKEEVEALKFLEKQPEGVVLTYLFNADKAKEAVANPPRSLYLYDSTAYVSAISGKKVFIEDEVNLNIMSYDWKKRRNEVTWFISNLDPISGKDFLKNNKIKYLYLVKDNSPLPGELLKLGANDLNLKRIFENKKSIIYEYGQDFGSD